MNAYWEYKPWWTPRRLTTSLDEVEIDRPIFILGVQGGGLTLLTRMLHRNERVVTIGGGRKYWVGNNEMDKHYIGKLPEDLTLRSPRYQSPTFKTHITGDETEHPVFGLERDWVYACDDLLDQYRKTERDWTQEKERRLRRAIKEALRAYAPAPNQARFLDMSQSFSLKVPLLRKIFPDARFIVETRDPYAVCMRAAQDYRYEWVRRLPSEEKLEAIKLKIFAEHWQNTFAHATEDLDDYSHKVLVRYEDLAEDPERELQRIAEGVGLAYDPDMVPRKHHRLPVGAGEQHKWYPVQTNRNEKYYRRLSPRMASVIEQNVGTVAEQFNYHPPA